MTKQEKNEYQKRWIKNNPEKYKAQKKHFYQKHRTEILLKNKELRKKDHKKFSAYSMKWRRNNRDKYNSYVREYLSTHKQAKRKVANLIRIKGLFKRRGTDYTKKVCQVPGCQEHGLIHIWDINQLLDISFICKKHLHQINYDKVIPDGIIRHF